MGRANVTLRTSGDRAKALDWVSRAEKGTRITFQSSKRSLPQNDTMWMLLTDVARQVEWYGQRLTPTDWKDIFTASLKGDELRIVPDINYATNKRLVILGMHTSTMDKEELSLLIDLIRAFGAEHGVVFVDTPKEEVAA